MKKKTKMKSHTHHLAKTVRILTDWLAIPLRMSIPLKLVHVSLDIARPENPSICCKGHSFEPH